MLVLSQKVDVGLQCSLDTSDIVFWAQTRSHLGAEADLFCSAFCGTNKFCLSGKVLVATYMRNACLQQNQSWD